MKTLLEEKISLITPKKEWEEVYRRVSESLKDVVKPEGVFCYSYISPEDDDFEVKFIRNHVLRTYGIDRFFETVLVPMTEIKEMPYGKKRFRVWFHLLPLELFIDSISPLEVYKNYDKIIHFFSSLEYAKLSVWCKSKYEVCMD